MRFLSLMFIAAWLCLVGSSNAESNSYNGYHLIRAFPTQKSHFELLAELEQTDDEFDVWNALKVEPYSFDISLPPLKFLKYKSLFESKNLKFQVMSSNLQRQIDTLNSEMSQSRRVNVDSIINRYVRHQEINDFVDQTVAANSDIATSYVAGTTTEGRKMKVIVLNPVKTSTRSLWVDCGIHAREWVSPATCVYMIDTLIKEYRENNAETVAIFNKYQIHILPSVNPDGYEYSHTTKRLWRKNRNLNSFSSCVGVDLNRNWGFKWMTGGASSNPCSDIYAGESADSELETQAVQEALRKREGNWDVYINIHSYSSMWLLPFGYAYTWIEKPFNYDDMMAKAKIGADALKAVYGEKYQIGASSDMLYINSGSGKDWANGVLKVPYSYVLELRPGANSPEGYLGFLWPESRMPIVSSETYTGIKAVFSSLV